MWSPPWFHPNWLKRAPWAAFWHHIAVFLSRKRPIVQLLMFSLKNLPCMLCCIPKLWPWLHFGILQNRRQHLSLSAPPLKSTLSTSAQTRATFNIVLNTKCTFFQKIYAEFCSELLNIGHKLQRSINTSGLSDCWKINTKVFGEEVSIEIQVTSSLHHKHQPNIFCLTIKC